MCRRMSIQRVFRDGEDHFNGRDLVDQHQLGRIGRHHVAGIDHSPAGPALMGDLIVQ